MLKKVFIEANSNKQAVKKDLTKKQTECKRQIDEVNIKYGLGQINEEVYSTTINTLKLHLTDIENGLEQNNENLSNLKVFIGEAIANVCKLGSLWKQGDFEQCQKLQKVVHPEGVLWKKDIKSYLTKTDNAFLTCMSSVSGICKNDETKKSEIPIRISDLVECPLELSNEFIADFRRIICLIDSHPSDTS